MDNNKEWGKILKIIKGQINIQNFSTWFSQTSLHQINDERLIISVPSAFIKGELIRRYDNLISSTTKQVTGKHLSVEYLINSSKFTKKIPIKEEGIFPLGNIKTANIQNPLNPKFTLENFMVGFTNNLAFAAAQAVVQNPGVSYNPLFIYGQSGVGKTHLMLGIGNALLSKKPYYKVVYAPSEKFMNDFVDSIQTKKTGDFRQKYRSCDILLIDDIQFISGKDSTQQEFFHLFNELQNKNSQLVFTSDRPPNEIVKLEPRLQSRFQGGLMVDIQLPDFDTRVAILKAKIKERGEFLDEEYIKIIAETVESNTRELEGKLIQIIQLIKTTGNKPELDYIKKLMGKPHTNTQFLDHKKVLAEINQYFNIRMADLTGPRRQKELVIPRQIAMFLMYEECNLPMERIGQILGGRDHTTILHGIEKIRQLSQRDRELQRLVLEVRQGLIS
ncbi:chromosomal replication initiator protein DnaA [Candidatus Daviesbacteria bacterium]|nr:chromosomal replication initiator protein DnaA [Candidatus Daviesbacteria bacterium]